MELVGLLIQPMKPFEEKLCDPVHSVRKKFWISTTKMVAHHYSECFYIIALQLYQVRYYSDYNRITTHKV